MGAPHDYAFAALYARSIGCHLALARLGSRVLCGYTPGLYEPSDCRLCDQERRALVLSPSRGLRFPWQREVQSQNRIPDGGGYCIGRGSNTAPGFHAHIDYGRYLAIVQIPDGDAFGRVLRLSESQYRDLFEF